MLGDSDEHRPYEDYAVRHVMGSLDEAESGAFRSHLLDCADCRARVGELRSIASDLAEVERVERRERAARVVETKERETDEDDAGDDLDDPPGRNVRVVAVVGAVLLVLLSIWNFVLRGENSRLEGFADDLLQSAETINFGDPWTTEEVAPDHEGIARVEDGQLAVMVRGTDDRARYAIDLYNASGGLLATRPVESREGQIRWFRGEPLRAEVERVEVNLDRGNGGETVVFRAVAR